MGDFNGDGKDDIVTANGESNSVSVLLGNGTHSFSTPLVTPLGDRSILGVSNAYLEVGDFNGDQRTDIVTANGGSQTISVLLSLAPPTAPSLQTIRGQSYPGDQSMVIVAQNSGTVILLGSCPSGLLNWTGSDGQHGRSNSSGAVTILVPTTATGVFSYTGTCEIGTCTSPAAVATVTVMAPPPPPPPFSITAITDVTCVSDGPTARRLSFTPQYSGINGRSITFSVRNELVPTTAIGPYSLHLFVDNPIITLQAQQAGTAGVATYDFNWLSGCATPSPDLPIRYVRPGGRGDGSSWANASGDPRAMLLASTAGNQVWVAAGTYKPTPSTNRTLSFVVPSGVQIYGGFTGTETSLMQRRLTYPLTTVLSGEIGTDSPNDNTYHVVTFLNVAAGTILDGFVIRDGHNGPDTELPAPPGGHVGAGVFAFGNAEHPGSPTLQNCEVRNNSAGISGGGVYATGRGAVTMTNCLIVFNNAERGGGVFAGVGFVSCATTEFTPSTSLVITNCTISNNSSRVEGRQIQGGIVLMKSSIIWDNSGATDSYSINCLASGSQITYSLVRNVYSGFGPTNLNADPQFVEPYGSTINYRLQATSPAINTGNPDGTGLPATDLAGNARVADSRVDMGAFEYGSTVLTSGLTLLAPNYDCLSGAFTFRTDGSAGRAIEYRAVPGITNWTTNPNLFVDAGTRTACDAPVLTLQARFAGEPASEVTRSWSIRAVCPACGPETMFTITGVTGVRCVVSGPTERLLTFSPQYSGTNGQPITFQVRNELSPTAAIGPYTLRLYVDNPTIHLEAQQTATAGTAAFDYHWLSACTGTGGARMAAGDTEAGLMVRVMNSPTNDSRIEVEVDGVPGQRLRFTVMNTQGKVIDDFWVDKGRSTERQWVKLSEAAGIYMLRVSATAESQLVKILKQ